MPLNCQAEPPGWFDEFNDKLDKLRGNVEPINDINMHEHFKNICGYSEALKCRVSGNQTIIYYFKCDA